MSNLPAIKISFVVNANVPDHRDWVELHSLFGELNSKDTGSYFETLLINRHTLDKISYEKFSQKFLYVTNKDKLVQFPVSRFNLSQTLCDDNIISKIISKTENLRRDQPSIKQVVFAIDMANDLRVLSTETNTEQIHHFARSTETAQEIRKGTKNTSGIAVGYFKRITKKSDTFRLRKNTIIAGPYAVVKNIADKRINGLIVIPDTHSPHGHVAFHGPKITIESKNLHDILDGTFISLNSAKGEIVLIGKVPSPPIKKTTQQLFYDDFSHLTTKSVATANGYSFLNAFELIGSILKTHKSGSYTDALVTYLLHDLKINPRKPFLYQSVCVASGTKNLLGKQGGQYIRHNPDFFIEELRALHQLLYIYNFSDITLTIPFVRTVKEFESIKTIILKERLTRSHKFKLYITVQIPANILQLEDYLDTGVDGVILDLQCLTDLTLGIDSHLFKKDYKKAEHTYQFIDDLYKSNNGAGVCSIDILKKNNISLEPSMSRIIEHCRDVAQRRRTPLYLYFADNYEEDLEKDIKKQTNPSPRVVQAHGYHI